jgi:glycosyltransferase involved in cell wall biosynthesis
MSGERHRVLFMAPLPPPVGGVAEVSRGLYESALRERFELRAVDFTKRRENRIRTFTVEAGDFVWGVRFWLRLVREILRFRPEVLYLASSFDFSFLRNVVLMATGKIAGAKVVCHFHGHRSGALLESPGPFLRLLLRVGARSFDRIIYLSEGIGRSVEEVLRSGKGVVVRNFIDLNAFRPSRGLTCSPPRMVFIGRITVRKGIFVLLEAASVLKSEGYAFALDFLGLSETVEEEAAVAHAVDAAGLKDRTVFHGVLEGEAKSRILEQASLLVLPSWADIFPVVVLEAYASGLPVVAASVAAVPEMVSEGVNGYLVAPRDVNSLVRALRRLLDDPALRVSIGRTNRALAERDYGVDTAAARVGTVFDELIR